MNALILLRLPEVLHRTGRSQSSHYEDMANGLFPRPVSIGTRAVAWPEHEVQAVVSARIAGKSVDEIRALVRDLEARRITAAA